MNIGGRGRTHGQRMSDEDLLQQEMTLIQQNAMWGLGCPAPKADWLFAEYNDEVITALVDYRHFALHSSSADERTHAILRRTHKENGEPVPFLVVRYWPDIWAFKLKSINKAALELLELAGRRTGWTDRHVDTAGWLSLTEREFVEVLLLMRKPALTLGDRRTIDYRCEKRPPPPEVAPQALNLEERTRYKIQISRRHRTWPDDCPGTDLDSLMCEFNHSVSVALVDYKNPLTHDDLRRTNRATINVLGSLYDANTRQLPFFVVKYFPESDWAVKVLPANDSAWDWLARYEPKPVFGEWIPMTQHKYVAFLYFLRNGALQIQDQWRLFQLGQTFPPSDCAEVGA